MAQPLQSCDCPGLFISNVCAIRIPEEVARSRLPSGYLKSLILIVVYWCPYNRRLFLTFNNHNEPSVSINSVYRRPTVYIYFLFYEKTVLVLHSEYRKCTRKNVEYLVILMCEVIFLLKCDNQGGFGRVPSLSDFYATFPVQK